MTLEKQGTLYTCEYASHMTTCGSCSPETPYVSHVKKEAEAHEDEHRRQIAVTAAKQKRICLYREHEQRILEKFLHTRTLNEWQPIFELGRQLSCSCVSGTTSFQSFVMYHGRINIVGALRKLTWSQTKKGQPHNSHGNFSQYIPLPRHRFSQFMEAAWSKEGPNQAVSPCDMEAMLRSILAELNVLYSEPDPMGYVDAVRKNANNMLECLADMQQKKCG